MIETSRTRNKKKSLGAYKKGNKRGVETECRAFRGWRKVRGTGEKNRAGE